MRKLLNTFILAGALVASAALFLTADAPAQQAKGRRVYRAWTKADLVDVAAVHASKLPKASQPYVRYVDLSAVAPDLRLDRLRVLGYVVNSWSRYDRIAVPKAVAGTDLALAYFDLSTLRDIDDAEGLEQLVKAFDDLGRVGSGPTPFPEPYFHAVAQTKDSVVTVEDKTEEYDEPYTERYRYYETRHDGYGGTYYVERWGERQKTRKATRVVKGYTRKVKGERTVRVASHLNKATAAGLILLLKTDFPIFEYHWLLYNGLVEPRYHELLGLDDSLDSAKKLAAVDVRLSDKVGSKLRGAVLFSEVAHHNRILERTPSQHRQGRGSFWVSLDFKTSIDLQDVLKDVLNAKPDAGEIIFSLPNGLHGYFVVDAENKRLDKADGDVANNKRSKFRDTQVRTAYHCMACHLPDKGWIEIDDEVRALSRKTVTLIADAFDKTKKDKAKVLRGEVIRRLYLEDDINDLLKGDQWLLDASVKKATVGMDCGDVARVLVDSIYEYNEAPVQIAGLVRFAGYPSEAIEAAVREPGVDPVFAVIAAGRRGRRDQVERGFNQLATVLYKNALKAKEE